eukprot:g3314.t1
MADGVHASTGCQLWSSSIVLARHLMARPELVEQKKVLEVGAGCGLLGIAVARLASSTLITDGDEEVVRNLARNIDLNRSLWSSQGEDHLTNVASRVLRWEELLEDPWPREDHVEVIVCSDVIYGNWGDTVAEALCSVLAPGGLVVLAASEDRRGGVKGFQDRERAGGSDIPTASKVDTLPLQGQRHGGIIVRRASIGVAKEDYQGRLKHGALVQELQRTKDRLLYRNPASCDFIAVSLCSTRVSAGCGALIWRKLATSGDSMLALRIVLIILGVIVLLGLIGAYCWWRRRQRRTATGTAPLTSSKETRVTKPDPATVGASSPSKAPKTISAQNEEGEAMSEAFRKTIPTYWGT